MSQILPPKLKPPYEFDEWMCPVTTDFLGEHPVIGVDALDDRWRECDAHPYSLEGMCTIVAKKIFENRDDDVTCGNCRQTVTVFMLDQKTLASELVRQEPSDSPEKMEDVTFSYQHALQEWKEARTHPTATQMVEDSMMSSAVLVESPKVSAASSEIFKQKEEEWRNYPYAPLIDRCIQEFKKVNQLDIVLVRQIYDEIYGEKVLDEESEPASTPRPVVRDEECCIAKVGIFNVTLLSAFTLAATIYAYFSGMFTTTCDYIEHGRDHHRTMTTEDGTPFKPHNPLNRAPIHTGSYQ